MNNTGEDSRVGATLPDNIPACFSYQSLKYIIPVLISMEITLNLFDVNII